MKTLLLISLLLLAGCGGGSSSPSPVSTQPVNTETFDDMLYRTEGATCSIVTSHNAASPAPDCKLNYDSFVAGRNRVARKYPQALNVKMSQVTFYEPKLYWAESDNCSLYPCFDRLGGLSPNPIYDRGSTDAPLGTPYITYAYSEVIEHEATHAIMLILFPNLLRDPADIAVDPGESTYDGPPLDHIFQITCHNTPDDFAGDGPAGNRAGCSKPYSGPPKP